MPEESGGSLARQGVRYVLFMKLVAIATVILLTMFARGVGPGIVIIIVIVPFWLLAEKMMSGTDSQSFWKSTEEKEEFSRLPLVDDVKKMRGAKKGQKVKQAILEGRLKKQVYYALKNEYNLSEEEIKILDKDLERITKKVDNEVLIQYIKNARDLNDLKKPKGDDRVDLFSEEGKRDLGSKKVEFEEKIKSAINELERLHYVG